MTLAPGAIEARLRGLEQKVSQLAGQAGGGEQLSPNYLTVSPTGQVGAQFSGQVSAQGIILPESTTNTFPPPLVNSIEWERVSDGTAVAYIVAVDSSVGVDKPQLLISARAPDNTGSALVQLAAFGSTTSTPEAALTITQQIEGTVAALSALLGDGSNAIILQQGGLSSFLQLAAGAQRLDLAFGTQTLTWAASTSSNTPTPAHGLGRTPQLVLLQAQAVPFAAGIVLTAKVPAANNATFTMNAEASAAVTGNVTFYWAAIG